MQLKRNLHCWQTHLLRKLLIICVILAAGTLMINFYATNPRELLTPTQLYDVMHESHRVQKIFVSNNLHQTPKRDARDTMSDNRGPGTLRILYWTKLNIFWPEGNIKLRNSSKSCFFTRNASLLPQVDALIYHPSFTNRSHMPPMRLANQKWVFFSLEAPYHSLNQAEDIRPISDQFNVTMTYSSASSVRSRFYGWCEPKRTTPPQAAQLLTSAVNQTTTRAYVGRGKTKLAAWFVSHCSTRGRREVYVSKLKRFMPVDIYGRCGNLKCEPRQSPACNKLLLKKQYFFYLSFENALCEDYITEKVFDILRNHVDVVPVVYGIGNYSRDLPPKSYIDVRDFATPKHLAEYLTWLASNGSAYEEYFRWRETWICRKQDSEDWLRLCDHLHRHSGRREYVDNVEVEWGVDRQCVKRVVRLTD